MNRITLEVRALTEGGVLALGHQSFDVQLSEPLDHSTRLALEDRVNSLAGQNAQLESELRIAKDDRPWQRRPWWRKAFGLPPK